MSSTKTDRTLESEATGVDVVDAVIDKINRCGIFSPDQGIMKRTAYVESKFGKDGNTFWRVVLFCSQVMTISSKYHGGIWQIDSRPYGAFNRLTRYRQKHKILDQELIPKVEKHFGIEWSKIKL